MANSFQDEQDVPEFDRISELAENIVLRLPRCEPIMIRKTIQDVFRDFCRETRCMTSKRKITREASKKEYPLFPVFGGVIMNIRCAFVGNVRVDPYGFSVIYIPSPLIVLSERLVVTDTDTVGITVIQEELPSMNSENAPRGFIQAYGDAICSGVVSRLCSMSGRSWSDQQIYAIERVNYENAKSEERMRRETPIFGRFIDTSQIL